MTPNELRLAAKFLDEHEDTLANDGCNDWEFPDWMSEPERIAFVREFHEINGSPEEFDPKRLRLPNYCAVAVLVNRLRKLADETTRNA